MAQTNMRISINIKADEVFNNNNGTFTIMVPAEELPAEVHATVNKVLPNLAEKFYELVHQEALLASLAKPHEVNAKNEYGDTIPASPVLPPLKKRPS